MSRRFLTALDLAQNEIQNARLQNLAGAPGSPVAGQIYYDTTNGAAYIFNGTAWIALDASKLSAAIPNAALATNPLARANHTGTQLSGTISDFASTVQGYRLDQHAAPAGNIAMAGFKFTGLPTPTAAGDSAEYSWVVGQIQSAAAGIVSRPPVRAVAGSNITLSGTQTVDGVTLVAGDRVLAVAQTAASANGVYVVVAGAWSRAITEDQATEVSAGAMWLATEGTTYAGSQWRQATTGTIVLGTTALSIVQFGAGASYTAGNGIVFAGSAITVNPAAGGGITVAAGGVSVDAAVVARKYSATIGDGAATSIVVTHNLGTQDIQPAIRQAASPFGFVECDINATSTSTATFVFATAPAANAYRVTIFG